MSIFVEISNLGPLRSAKVELADLTLLVGENNTGKTFFATVLHRVLVAPRSEPWPRNGLIEKTIPSEVLEWFESQLAPEGDESGATDGIRWSTPQAVLQWATDYTTARLSAFGANVRDGMEYAYGAGAAELRRRTASRRSGDCYLRVQSVEPAWEVEVRFDSDDVRVTPPDPDAWLERLISDEYVRAQLTTRYQRREDPRTNLLSRYTARWLWYWVSRDGLFSNWPRHAVHLPAARTGIMQGYQVLAGAVVRQSAAAGIWPIEIDPLPGTSADFLSLLLSDPDELPMHQREDPRFRTLIEDFEKNLRAEIALEERPSSVAAVTAITPEGRFPLSRTSAMLSELAPLLLVLKGYLGRADYLTIDEPEAHLHPDMQRKVASFIADVVAQEVGIVLTTHSDYFFGEINNAIRSRILVDPGVSRLGDKPSRLEKPSVCALLFSREDRWCVGRRLAVDPVNGIDESTFTRVMQSLYDDSVRLINDLI